MSKPGAQKTYLVTLVAFVKVTPGSGEETTVVDLGKGWVTVMSLRIYFVVKRPGSSVVLVVGMMSEVSRLEESARRQMGWIDR